MASIEAMVRVVVEYRILFIPFGTYKRIGEVAILTIWGMPVYKRVGKVSSIFGIVRHAP